MNQQFSHLAARRPHPLYIVVSFHMTYFEVNVFKSLNSNNGANQSIQTIENKDEHVTLYQMHCVQYLYLCDMDSDMYVQVFF